MSSPFQCPFRLSLAGIALALGTLGDPAGAAESSSGDWKHSSVIRLNTTPDAADVAGDVRNYPLAVLLSSKNFDFSQARSNGQDLRFFDAAGKPLLHAIENWDVAAQSAAVWVKLPVVKGNDKTQSILMKWGQAAAPDVSDSKAVFSREDGYLAVFHLDEEGNTSPNGYHDASGNQVHGTAERLEPGSRVDGRIGKGTRFANPNGGETNQVKWIRVGGAKVTNDFNFSEVHPITASAWAWADSFNGYYETIFSKGDRSWTLQRDWDKRIEVCTLVTNQPKNYHSCAIASKTNHPPVTKVWNHYLITASPGKLSLYVNGRFVESVGGTTLPGFHDFGIANNTQHADKPKEKRGWDGILDEVRVMAVEKNADWARLDYESQREGQKLLTFEP